VVAALLDEYLASRAREKEGISKQILEDFIRQTPELTGPMDSLMLSLSHFATPDDLTKRINEIFEVCDPDSSGKVDFETMNDGLKTLSLGNEISFSYEDWLIFTARGHVLDPDGGLSLQSFQFLMRQELRQFSYRMISQEMNDMDSRKASSLLTLKLLLFDERRGFGTSEEPRAPSPPFSPGHNQPQGDLSSGKAIGSEETFQVVNPSPSSYTSHGVVLTTGKPPAAELRTKMSGEFIAEISEENLATDSPNNAKSGRNMEVQLSQKPQHFSPLPSAPDSAPVAVADPAFARGLAQVNARLSALDTNHAHLNTKMIALDFRVEKFQEKMESMLSSIVRKLDRSTEITTQVVQSENELLSSVLESRAADPAQAPAIGSTSSV